MKRDHDCVFQKVSIFAFSHGAGILTWTALLDIYSHTVKVGSRMKYLTSKI